MCWIKFLYFCLSAETAKVRQLAKHFGLTVAFIYCYGDSGGRILPFNKAKQCLLSWVYTEAPVKISKHWVNTSPLQFLNKSGLFKSVFIKIHKHSLSQSQTHTHTVPQSTSLRSVLLLSAESPFSVFKTVNAKIKWSCPSGCDKRQEAGG